ncbi:MAG: autotransporter-associated beta strand repeat-containing protein, partial [Fibrobacter sp.]|nr:autotransporter-associated beta strand repeat-containing protein [Fibrobacter sp.]
MRLLSLYYYKILLIMFVFQLFAPVFGGGYTDEHNDGSLTGWTTVGSRTWSESGGYALPQDNTNNYGCLINNYNCANNGTFTVTIHAQDASTANKGGIVFRYSNQGAYCLSAANNKIYVGKVTSVSDLSSVDHIPTITPFVPLNVSTYNSNNDVTIKIVLNGSQFEIYRNDVSVGSFTDATYSSGKVGYFHSGDYNIRIKIASSSWEDLITGYIWDVSPNSGFQPGNGTWGTHNYWSTDGTTLIPWLSGKPAIFAGDNTGTYKITLNGTQNASALTFTNSTYTLTDGGLGISDTFKIAIDVADSAIINSVISGAGHLKVTPTTEPVNSGSLATLYLGGENTYSGSTTIYGYKTRLNVNGLNNGGVSSSIGLSDSSASNLVLDGGQLRTYGDNTATTNRLFTLTEKGGIIFCSGSKPINFTSPEAIVFSGSGARTLEFGGSLNSISSFSPVIGDGTGGATSIKKTGSGTFELLGVNTYTGTIEITGGAIACTSASNLGPVDNTSQLILNGGTLLYYGEQVSLNSNIKRSLSFGKNGGTLNGSGNSLLWLANENNIEFVESGSRTITLSGTYDGNWLKPIITDYNNDANNPTSIFKTGTGRWTLTGNNTATGTITIDQGVLEIGVSDNYGTINGPVVNNGTLRINRGRDENDNFSFSKGISGTGELVKWGNGTLTLSGTNTYTGNTWINTGTLRLGGSNVIPDGESKGDVNVTGIYDSLGVFKPATFNLDSYSETVNGLNGSGNVKGSGTLTIGANNANSNFTGVISSSLQLVKTGTGIVVLNGNNTYTGATTVSQGEFRVNGSISSEVTVYSGAKLSGNGTINSTVSIVGYAEVNPGSDDAGKLTTGNLVLNELSVLNFDLGLESDTIAVNGNLTLDGVLNIKGTSSFTSGVYTLFTYTGNLTNSELRIGDTPAGSYLYDIDITENNKVKLNVISIGDLLPVTVVENGPLCSVSTSKWTLVFDNNKGGGISTLTDSSSPSVNQIGESQNLFFVRADGADNSTNGSWAVQQKGTFFVIINQSGTLWNGVSYTNEYAIHGSGKMFITTTVMNNGASDLVTKNIFIGVERSNVPTMSLTSDNSVVSATRCQYILLSSSGDRQNDILLSIKDVWDGSVVGIPNSVTSLFNNINSAGYECNTFKLGGSQRQSWEFMVDFSHQDWSTESDVLPYVNDYRQHDSLVFVKGTVAMERDWEQHLYGHWKFDEVGTSLAVDESGNNYHGTKSASRTECDGIYGRAIKFDGSSNNVTVDNAAAFDGNSRFTVMAWVWPSPPPFSKSQIISKHDGTSGWEFGMNSSKELYLKLDGSEMYGTALLSDTEWNHVAVSFTPGEVIFYVNGKYDKVQISSNNVTPNTADLTIGTGFRGTIDDVRFYGNVIPETTMKSIFRNGFRSGEGVYDVRANNNNTLDLYIDGGTITRRFPIFRIANYWSTSVPASGCVRLGNRILVENTDYYADLIDGWNVLYIGLKRVIVSDSVNLYIDDASKVDAVKRETPKMVSGVENISNIEYFWAKNFTKGSFGSADSKEWYLNWKMSYDNGYDGKDGDIFCFASSAADPNEIVSPANHSNLTNYINSNSAGKTDSWGTYSLEMGGSGKFPKTSEYVTDTVTYAVVESSSVRVKLRVNERHVYVDDTRTFKIVTGWSIYPTGQIFKWDSITYLGGSPTSVYVGTSMRKLVSNPTFYSNTSSLRGAVILGAGYQDYVYAWLSMKNKNGYKQVPFTKDYINTQTESDRIAFDFCEKNMASNSVWSKDSVPIQTVTYLDIRKSSMNQYYMDSVANYVQTPLMPTMIAGKLLDDTSATEGDFNKDGFNEREGAYMIKKNNNNVNVTFAPAGGQCVFQPALIISNYTSTTKPQYVIIYNPDNQSGTETNLYEGQYYNAYLNRSALELVIQIDSVFCEKVGIYISASQTLAVQMSGFWGNSGDNSDTLFWKTESEKDNLGFLIYRRVSPVFYDSLVAEMNKNPDADLSKIQSLKSTDTLWEKITSKLIPGTQAG